MSQQRAKRGGDMRAIVLIVLLLMLPDQAMATAPSRSRAALPSGRASSQSPAQVAVAAHAGISDTYLAGASAAGHHVRQRLRLRRNCDDRQHRGRETLILTV
jgi:hypothetical protein